MKKLDRFLDWFADYPFMKQWGMPRWAYGVTLIILCFLTNLICWIPGVRLTPPGIRPLIGLLMGIVTGAIWGRALATYLSLIMDKRSER